MTLRVALIGCGAVASVHARQLATLPGVSVTAVYAPKPEKAAVFASAHGIEFSTDNIEGVLAACDAVIICSPSKVHYSQACRCLEARIHTLVELPACETLAEALQLANLSQDRGVVLQCAHSSRYVEPFRRIGQCTRAWDLGAVQQVTYIRHIRLRKRSWVDDALLHHAAHPLDLMNAWFNDLVPLACTGLPEIVGAQSVSLMAGLPGGAAVTMSISYTTRLELTQMVVVGELHTVHTDGFSFIHSDLEELM